MGGLDGAAASDDACGLPSTQPIFILIVDPSPFSRACTLAGFNDAPFLTVHACGSLEDAQRGTAPDVVMFHDHHRNGAPSNLSAQLLEAAEIWPGAAMLVIANPGSREQLFESLRGGARGFLDSNVSIEATLATIRAVTSNLVVYSDAVLELVSKAAQATEVKDDGGELAVENSLPGFHLLTPRQQEVLELLSLGLSNKVIGQRLQISESTVKVHIRGIMAQTGVTNRTQIVAHFLARA